MDAGLVRSVEFNIMARNLDPKCKQCRRVGEKLFLKGEKCTSVKCALVKRSYPPGQHGQRSGGRVSAYGMQLMEKQKARRMYRMLERQFRSYYEKAIRQRGNTGERLLQFLELRLDNVIYRLGLAKSRDQARQLVTHGHIQIDGRSTTVPSYQVRAGEVIKINPARKDLPYWTEAIKTMQKDQSIPSWLTLNEKTLEATVERAPAGDELISGLAMQQIVEYYSR